MDAPGDRHHDLTDLLGEAAVAAEMQTGVHEETVEEARAHLLVRLARISAGAFVTMVGLALLVLPGPGLLVVAAGLSILAVDVPFARRLLQQVQARLPRDATGATPRWLVVAGSLGLIGGIAFSVAYAVTG